MEKIKKYLKEAIIFAIILFIASNAISYFRTSNINSNKALNILKEYKTIENKSVKERIDSKKVLVINFWGTWCPVCKQELSSIKKLSKNKDITLITVAVNSGSNDDIKKYLKEHQASFNVINDNNGEIAKSLGVESFPTTIYYSPNRKKSIKDSGFTTYPGMIARVKMMK